MILRERNLELTLPPGTKAWKFDDDTHGLSHCMKAVDFIVELADRFLFIEIKDPEHSSATLRTQQKFIQDFQSGRLDEELKYKYRDSFLYQWACGSLKDKPIYYFVIVVLSSLTEADLLVRTEALRRQLPQQGPSSGIWRRRIVEDCAVFNLQAWNSRLPQYQIRRVHS
ncbi:MAG: hypothetical protein KatS3mg051_0544 [Anaerolineae bacterium]|nr:MAG: hypothetical protein KatS3mg051_0544 [Anaerolineae bacterium]